MTTLAKKLLVSVIAAVVGLVILELGARVLYGVYRQRSFDRAEVSDRLLGRPGAELADAAEPAPAALEDENGSGFPPTIVHPYFGFVANPAEPGINQYGFLGRVPFTTRSDDRLIVGLFGGSVADHMFRYANRLLSGTLQRSAPFRGKRVEFFDLAAPAYKQPQQLIILTTLLALGAQFDIVINLDGFNEIDAAKDNLQDGVNPFYPDTWKAYASRLLDHDVAVHLGKADLIRADRADLRRWFARWPVPQSAFLLTLWDFLDQRQAAALRAETMALRAALARSAQTPEQTGPSVSFADDEAMYREYVEVWARASLEMSILCAGHGIQYFHFLQPNQYLPGSKTLTAEEQRSAWDQDVADTHRVAIGYPMLIDRGRDLRTQDVNFVDLTMLFRDEAHTVYNDTCCHLNQRGSIRLATAIARTIVEANTVEGRDAP